MTVSEDEDEDESLAYYLESEVLSEVSDQEEAKAEEEVVRQPKKLRVSDDHDEGSGTSESLGDRATRMCIETEFFSKIPPELFHHILKFLSSEDLVSCSLVCRLLNYAASDESLWRRLYCMRWGLLPPTKKLRECPWKKLYIQRDEEDMVEFVRNCPSEFKEYYIQMQAAKRSQAPLRSQVNDDRIILDKTLADQVSIWKSSRGLTDKVVSNHDCSGETCTYYQIGDVFVCEMTGQVHEKLFWTQQMSFWFVQYLATVLIDYCHQLKWNQTLNSSKVVFQMKQSHSWGLAVLCKGPRAGAWRYEEKDDEGSSI